MRCVFTETTCRPKKMRLAGLFTEFSTSAQSADACRRTEIFCRKARREPIFHSPESAAPAACGKSATGNRRATCGKLLKRDGELPFLTGGKHFDRSGNQLVKTKRSVFFRFP
jgi:hypothetical protein